MLGPIKSSSLPSFLKPGKKTKKGNKRRSKGTYRDYRGVDGAVSDAQKKK